MRLLNTINNILKSSPLETIPLSDKVIPFEADAICIDCDPVDIQADQKYSRIQRQTDDGYENMLSIHREPTFQGFIKYLNKWRASD